MTRKKELERLQPAPKYIQELNALWKSNKDCSIKKFSVSRDPKLRPKAFITELYRMAYITSDPAFMNAILAMEKHGFIDSSFGKFLSPASEQEVVFEELCIRRMNDLIGEGRSIRRSAAQVAAEFGISGSTLEAAAKGIELLYQSANKSDAE